MPSGILQSGDAPKVLVVMPTWVGDAVMATPLLEAVHKTTPEASIDLLIKRQLRGLLDGAPWLRQTIEWKKEDGLWSLVGRLRRERYDWGVLLPNSFRPALLLWLARVSKRVGYMRNGRAPLLTQRLAFPKQKPFRMVDFYGAIGERVGLPAEAMRGPMKLYVETAARERAAQLFDAAGIAPGEPVIGLNPGAKYGSSKLWPAEYFAHTGDALSERHHARILVLAGPGEDALAADIVGKMKRPAVTFPSKEVDLATLKAVIARLDLMVSNDTGPRHMAAALDVPTVTIFGPTHTAWGDSGFKRGAELALKVDCGPCMQRTCPLGHHKCMRDLPPGEVIAAAERLWNPRPTAERT
jgi:heptosyltransferase-2